MLILNRNKKNKYFFSNYVVRLKKVCIFALAKHKETGSLV